MKNECLDLIGKRYGKLTVVKVVGYKHYQPVLLCKCDCGNEREVLRGNLLLGKTKSCGCLKKTEALNIKFPYYTKLWNVWYGIKDRCYNEKSSSYKHYGARGITMCEEWHNDFMAFYKWAIAQGYTYERTSTKYNIKSIDRIDNNGNYCPENCRWTTIEHQALNRSTNRKVTYKGMTLTVKELADQLGVDYMQLYNRLYKNNFDIDKAVGLLETGKRLLPKKVVQYDLQGNIVAEYESISQAKKSTGISRQSITRNCNGETYSTKGYIFNWR